MTRVFLDINEPVKPTRGPALFSSGHRPFFLLTALSAVFLIFIWIGALHGGLPLSPSWHGHEMLFGFASAAVGGFLMAAVPKWTNAPTPKGMLVVLLSLLWIFGRVAMVIGEALPEYAYIAYLDLLFLPALVLVPTRMIWGAKNKRNFVVIGILAAWIVTNVWYHFVDPYTALRAGVYVLMMLVALISGRVIPAFTQNALKMHLGKEISCATPAWTHKAIIILLSLIVILELTQVSEMASGALALALAFVLFFRMKDWKSLQTGFDPIVWILHAAYIWLPIGFALKAAAELGDLIDPNAALHALTTGAIGLLILAVASRAALGHSGRALKVSKPTTLAYILVISATVVRVFLPELSTLSGSLWIIGYGLFAIVYTPILIKPRIDGLPG